MKLYVDFTIGDDENDAPSSPTSWTTQLLRLVQEAPQPIPVTCAAPRLFPHFGRNRISECSWTSDTTRYTDITHSRRSSLDPYGFRAKFKDHKVENPSLEKPEGFTPIAKTDADKESSSSAATIAKVENLGTSAVNKECKGGEERSSFSTPQGDWNTTKHTEEQQQKPRTRNTLSFSIRRDSEYWEKFRHSKDYQSSLMIETICNEVFNLKPSPRYKSLMKLSLKNKDVKQMQTEQFRGSSNDETGINVVEQKGTKEGVKSISPHETQNKRKENDDEDEVESPSVATRLRDEKQAHPQSLSERQQRYNSTTSSVFTTTTEGDEYEEEELNRLAERDKLLKGFGQVFHGYLTKRETEKLLGTDGQYLIRQMWGEDGFILSIRFDGGIKNYRIVCDASSSCGNNENLTYCLEDRRKCHNSLDELVREGLITLYLDENAGSYIDLLVELAQIQRNDSLLQTPPAVSPGLRKTSRSASFRAMRQTSSSSVFASGGCVDAKSCSPSIMVTPAVRNSTDIALLIHYFEEEIFDGLAKCQTCSNGLWGPSNKGLRCRDCGFSIHESCIDSVRIECKPDLLTIPPFSTDLTTLVKGSYSTREGTHAPPYVLIKCINEVEQRGLSTEGIYRVSGSVEDIENLKTLFEKDRIKTDLSECQDIHSITGIIKLFLRQLPDSLIPEEVLEEFFIEQDGGELTMETVQRLILCLPPAHKLTLKFLLEHLNRIAKEKASNKMTSFNLSSVLVPSITGLSFNILESCTKLLHIMINHVDKFQFN